MEKGFGSIGGLDEVKQELREIADFLANPEKYKRFGANVPKGVLLYGPPGTGKTMLAKALAYESGCNFLYASGSEFIEKFVGVGAGRIRSLFEKAEKKRPCIVFIDEIDSIGAVRNADNNSERDQTLNQLLIEMDGFVKNDGVVIMAATNRIDMLDKALLRAGRFDRHIYFPNPSFMEREAILKLHFQNKPTDAKVDMKKTALRTSGFSGASLALVANEAALLAIRKDKSSVGEEEIDEAIIKISAGLKNKNMILSNEEKQVVAYHEAGHALMRYLTEGKFADIVSIVPHGGSLGFVMDGEREERYLMNTEQIENTICVLLAGRAAEEIMIGKITNGAQNDLKKANAYAEDCIMEYGMSRQYKNRVFTNISSREVMYDINFEISELLNNCYKKTASLLSEYKDCLTKLAEELLVKEILRCDDIKNIIAPICLNQGTC